MGESASLNWAGTQDAFEGERHHSSSMVRFSFVGAAVTIGVAVLIALFVIQDGEPTPFIDGPDRQRLAAPDGADPGAGWRLQGTGDGG